MNPRHITILTLVAAVLLAACSPAATQIAESPLPTGSPARESPELESPSLQLPAGTEAPSATQAPIGIGPIAVEPPAEAYLVTPAAPPEDMFFRDYGINPFVDAREDHLSTFALDVDTASYSLARRYVTDGLLPPPEAIRVEEFVNYFHQDYAAPDGTAFALFADGAPSPFQYDGTHLLRFGIQGYSVPDSERQPASLTFVIDVSGSMDMENRLGLVKRSLELLVERLRPSDTVAIVVYGSEARVVLNPTSGEDTGAILNAIYSLYPEGATNAEAGLRLGYQMANLAYRPDGINRVILCSDGVANVGETGPEAILESIRGYADAGISLTALGFGMGNFNDVLMEQLADNGDGNYAYIDSQEQAQRLFVDNLTSTLQVIALNSKVQVDFNGEAVSYWRLIGYENRDVADQDFRNNAVDAGEIGAGHTVTALYAVQLRPGAEGRLATVSLRWEDPDTHAVQEINGNFNTWDVARTFDDASLRYQLDMVVMQYAEVLRQSPWAYGIRLDDLRIRAERLAAQLPHDPDVAEFAQLVGQAALVTGW